MLEATLRRDRAVVAAGLLGLAVLAWVYVAGIAAAMPSGMMPMP